MEEFVAYIIKNLVSDPETVSVESKEGEEEVRIEIHVADEDLGKVIGRRGNTINALRTIVRTVATRLGKRVQVELIQPDREAESESEEIVEAAPEVLVSAEPQREAIADEAPLEEVALEEAAVEEPALT